MSPKSQNQFQLTPELFTAEFLYLAEWFGKKLDPGSSFGRRVIREYYDYVAARLSAEEFLAARAIAFDELRFLPAPKDFVALVNPHVDFRLRAEREWDEIMKISQRDYLSQHQFFESASSEVKESLSRVGGLVAIARCDPFTLKSLARRFKSEMESILTQKDRKMSSPALPSISSGAKQLTVAD